jgi:hypothetical protein
LGAVLEPRSHHISCLGAKPLTERRVISLIDRQLIGLLGLLAMALLLIWYMSL